MGMVYDDGAGATGGGGAGGHGEVVIHQVRVLYGVEVEGPDGGCYGCQGSGVHVLPSGELQLCTCVICPSHAPDPCDCFDSEAGQKIAITLRGQWLARHPLDRKPD